MASNQVDDDQPEGQPEQEGLRSIVERAVNETSTELRAGYTEANYQALLWAKLDCYTNLSAHKEVAFTMYSRHHYMLGTCRADIVVERRAWETIEGAQVNVVQEGLIIEVKAGIKFARKHYGQIQRYMQHYPDAYPGLLVYFGLNGAECGMHWFTD